MSILQCWTSLKNNITTTSREYQFETNYSLISDSVIIDSVYRTFSFFLIMTILQNFFEDFIPEFELTEYTKS